MLLSPVQHACMALRCVHSHTHGMACDPGQYQRANGCNMFVYSHVPFMVRCPSEQSTARSLDSAMLNETALQDGYDSYYEDDDQVSLILQVFLAAAACLLREAMLHIVHRLSWHTDVTPCAQQQKETTAPCAFRTNACSNTYPNRTTWIVHHAKLSPLPPYRCVRAGA